MPYDDDDGNCCIERQMYKEKQKDSCKEVILKQENLAYALYCERLIGVTWWSGWGGGGGWGANALPICLFSFQPESLVN